MRKSIFRPWNGLPMKRVDWPAGREPNDTKLGHLQYIYEQRVSRQAIRRDGTRKRYAIS